MAQTRRQQIVELVSAGEWSFDDLRHEFSLTVKVLEEDLRHIEHTVRASGKRFRVRPASCLGCGFAFTKMALHPPGRCPNCRERRVDGPWVKITV